MAATSEVAATESEEASGRCGLLDGRLALVTSVWPSEETGKGRSGRRETQRDGEGDSGNRGAGECLEVEDARVCVCMCVRWDRPGSPRGGFGGAARKHHRHSVRHTAFSMDARTE